MAPAANEVPKDHVSVNENHLEKEEVIVEDDDVENVDEVEQVERRQIKSIGLLPKDPVLAQKIIDTLKHTSQIRSKTVISSKEPN